MFLREASRRHLEVILTVHRCSNIIERFQEAPVNLYVQQTCKLTGDGQLGWLIVTHTVICIATQCGMTAGASLDYINSHHAAEESSWLQVGHRLTSC
jgi:hypothetical protein